MSATTRSAASMLSFAMYSQISSRSANASGWKAEASSARAAALALFAQLPEGLLAIDRCDPTVLEIVVAAVERLSDRGHLLQVPSGQAHLAKRGQGQTAVFDPMMDAVRGLLRSSNAFESRGIQALEQGDLATAASQFRQGLALDPNDASLHHRLGTALLLAGDAKSGREELETALRLAPNLARAHYSLAVLFVASGQFEQAVSRLSAAVRHSLVTWRRTSF